MSATFDGTRRFQIVKTWANWDSVKHEVLATVDDQQTAESHAEILHERFLPWSACYAREQV